MFVEMKKFDLDIKGQQSAKWLSNNKIQNIQLDLRSSM